MNGRLAKKIRKEAVSAGRKRDEKIVPELKVFINSLPWQGRIILAWRLLLGRF